MAVWGGRQIEVEVAMTKRETIPLLDNIHIIGFFEYLLWIILNSLFVKTGRI